MIDIGWKTVLCEESMTYKIFSQKRTRMQVYYTVKLVSNVQKRIHQNLRLCSDFIAFSLSLSLSFFIIIFSFVIMHRQRGFSREERTRKKNRFLRSVEEIDVRSKRSNYPYNQGFRLDCVRSLVLLQTKRVYYNVARHIYEEKIKKIPRRIQYLQKNITSSTCK